MLLGDVVHANVAYMKMLRISLLLDFVFSKNM